MIEAGATALIVLLEAARGAVTILQTMRTLPNQSEVSNGRESASPQQQQEKSGENARKVSN
jgi:hypothetical protein